MKAVIQRVSRAKVTIGNRTVGEIGRGLLVLLAIKESDNPDTIKWMCNKLANLRIFEDEEEKMNLSVQEINGSILLISNFTIYSNVQKGFRPSFIEAAAAKVSEPVYNKMVEYFRANYPINIATGEFGAMMDIELVNEGPVTIIVEK